MDLALPATAPNTEQRKIITTTTVGMATNRNIKIKEEKNAKSAVEQSNSQAHCRVYGECRNNFSINLRLMRTLDASGLCSMVQHLVFLVFGGRRQLSDLIFPLFNNMLICVLLKMLRIPRTDRKQSNRRRNRLKDQTR